MKKPGRKPGAELIESRNVMEQYAAGPSPEVDTVTQMDADGVPVLRIVPHGGLADAAVLQFHGGAYRRGSPRVFAAQLAKNATAAGGVQLFSVRYRLAETARGSTVLALVDLRIAASSFAENAQSDTLFSAEKASEAAEQYLGGQDANHPLASPAFGAWTGQPPLLVFVRAVEVLRDDSLLLAKTAVDVGVAVQLERFEGPQHIWPIIDFPRTDEAVRAVELVREFMANQLQLFDPHS